MPGARILLIEDDGALCDVVGRNLLARGHDVHIAVDAESALAQLRSAPFDLIILDICLPDQTGWESHTFHPFPTLLTARSQLRIPMDDEQAA